MRDKYGLVESLPKGSHAPPHSSACQVPSVANRLNAPDPMGTVSGWCIRFARTKEALTLYVLSLDLYGFSSTL